MATESSVTSIRVRMYRHGFGDCFLLSFFHARKRVFSMLVDCGLRHGTRSEEVPIEDVIADLKKTLTVSGGQPKLDVLVATHEHWDHISFFHPEKYPDLFAEFEIGQVWLAWTEDPKDKEATAINSRLREGVAALQVAVAGLKESQELEAMRFSGLHFGADVTAARESFNASLENVLDFYGVTSRSKVSRSGIRYKPKGKVSVETEVAINHISELGRNGGGIHYLSPGTMVSPKSVPAGVNIYVLGPPRSSRINKSRPSTRKGKPVETYLSIDDSGLRGFVDGLLQLGAEQSSSTNVPEEARRRHTGPFHASVGLSPEKARDEFPWLEQTYFRPDEEYRRIEHNWMDIAGQFALQLDGAINNTSLVLAIELAESGKVLLFPGDAQVGSWLSWHDHTWKVKRASGTEEVTAEQLLNNTVLYKVSHHGSHNATIR
ncbi:MAG: hypothetical protein KDA96_20925, partial [Planctomycetaceae bacterium]|nr:hypothetical protein [Planctomycetaceae bacterium]